MKNESWTIYWNEYAKDAYLYGSELFFHSKDNVEFKNDLMPPGTVIKTWHSKTNYQMDRIEPTLPMIDGEGSYHITYSVSKDAENYVFIKVVYFDRYGYECGSKIIRDKEAYFKCPLKTFSYDIQLISSGVRHFTFHSITITEISDEEKI